MPRRFSATTSDATGDSMGDVTGDQGNFAADALTLTAQTNGADYNGVRISVTAGASTSATYDAAQNTLAIVLDNTALQDATTVAAALDTGAGR